MSKKNFLPWSLCAWSHSGNFFLFLRSFRCKFCFLPERVPAKGALRPGPWFPELRCPPAEADCRTWTLWGSDLSPGILARSRWSDADRRPTENTEIDYNAELDKYIEQLKSCKYIQDDRAVKKLCEKAKELLMKEENIIYLNAPITVRKKIKYI